MQNHQKPPPSLGMNFHIAKDKGMMNMETFILNIFIDQNTLSCPIEHREEFSLVMDIKLSWWTSIPGLSSDALCLLHGLLKRKDLYSSTTGSGVSVAAWFVSCSDDHNPHYGDVSLTGPDYIALLSQCWPGWSTVLIRRLWHGFCGYGTLGAKTGTSQGKWEPPHPKQPVMWVGMLLSLTMQNCANRLWLVSGEFKGIIFRSQHSLPPLSQRVAMYIICVRVSGVLHKDSHFTGSDALPSKLV